MWLCIITRALVVLGSLNYLLCYAKIDMFKLIGDACIIKIIKLLIGLAALMLLVDRNYYLPFLGKTAIPIAVSKKNTNNKNLTKIKLTDLPPNTYVIAWAAKKSDKTFNDPFKAYDNYSNYDLVKSDKDGNAVVQVECPGTYIVNKFGIIPTELDRHIHYRYQLPEYKGMFSEVLTKKLNSKCQ